MHPKIESSILSSEPEPRVALGEVHEERAPVGWSLGTLVGKL